MRFVKDKQGRYVNPCSQINTSVFSMQKTGVSVSSDNTEPQFMQDDDRPLDLWRSQDPLYYRSFDPQKYHEIKDRERIGEQSEQAAKNINAVVN